MAVVVIAAAVIPGSPMIRLQDPPFASSDEQIPTNGVPLQISSSGHLDRLQILEKLQIEPWDHAVLPEMGLCIDPGVVLRPEAKGPRVRKVRRVDGNLFLGPIFDARKLFRARQVGNTDYLDTKR